MAFQPLRKYDLDEASDKLAQIRVSHKQSDRKAGVDAFEKQYAIHTSGAKVATGIPQDRAEAGITILEEYAKLHADLLGVSRQRLDVTASVYFDENPTDEDRARWKMLRRLFSSSSITVFPGTLIGADMHILDDDLRVFHVHSVAGVGFIAEPHWTDIVTVLETSDICPIHKYSGVIRQGMRYCWRDAQDIELKGTRNPSKEKGVVHRLGPCRNLSCASNSDGPFRKCSRCKEAVYCSQQCQRAHWKLVHKKLCKAVVE